jgi:multisubunit Na+/H+ antiporter MnhG subunit
MIEAILITICVLVITPILAYLIGKGATFGFYSGKRMFENPQDNKNNDKEKGEN